VKLISVLGSTGSIGVQTLDVVRLHPGLFKVEALAAGSNVELLERQAREFRPSLISCATPQAAEQLRERLKSANGVRIEHSTEGAVSVATADGVDLVVGALPGSTGLVPTFAAVHSGKDIALATKEVLVMAGGLFMETVRERGIKLLPVDSEQSAIFQCLQGNAGAKIKRIMLTASGGPFRDLAVSDMEKVTREQTLNHPRWKMGPKVTVDSATLMNKGLEVIEARWLFDVPESQIEVVVHPQSIVHSMVEFVDGGIMAQLGATDMRIPISYALGFPDRISSGTDPISFPEIGSLTFMKPDFERFPLLRAAYSALEERGPAGPIILNAADEVAVELFLSGQIPFHHIARIVLESLGTIHREEPETLAEIMEYHRRVVDEVRRTWLA
jgi:1-deoxy-D-xylulose-5-phosphate reductoisomerase